MNRKQKMIRSNIAIFCFFVLSLIFLVIKVNSNQIIHLKSSGSESLVFVIMALFIVVLFIFLTFYLPMLFVVKYSFIVEIKYIPFDIIEVFKNIKFENKTNININSKICVCRC